MQKCKLFVIVGAIAFFVMASNAFAALDTSFQVDSTLTLDSDFNLNIGFTGDQNVGTFVIKIAFNNSLVSIKSVTMPTGINVPVSEKSISDANSTGEIEFNYFDLAMTGFDPTATENIVIIFTSNALGDAFFGGTFSLAGTQPTDPVINGTYTDVTRTITEGGGGHTIIASVTPAEGGSITPSGSIEVADGADQTFTVTTNSGYTASVVVDGATATLTNNTYTFTNVTANHSIAVTFTPIVTTHTITASATPAEGGSITPSGSVEVADGADHTFTVTTNSGYTANVVVDGATATLTNNTYTFTNVTADHSISVTFNATTTTVGDGDGNGTVDIFDALAAALYDAGMGTPVNLDQLDVVCPLGVDINDALQIAKYDAGLVTELTVVTSCP